MKIRKLGRSTKIFYVNTFQDTMLSGAVQIKIDCSVDRGAPHRTDSVSVSYSAQIAGQFRDALKVQDRFHCAQLSTGQ